MARTCTTTTPSHETLMTRYVLAQIAEGRALADHRDIRRLRGSESPATLDARARLAAATGARARAWEAIHGRSGVGGLVTDAEREGQMIA